MPQKQRKWKLYIGIPTTNREDPLQVSAELQEYLNEYDSCLTGSGYGLGYRDIDWTFSDETTAGKAKERALEFFEMKGIKVDDHEDQTPMDRLADHPAGAATNENAYCYIAELNDVPVV